MSKKIVLIASGIIAVAFLAAVVWSGSIGQKQNQNLEKNQSQNIDSAGNSENVSLQNGAEKEGTEQPKVADEETAIGGQSEGPVLEEGYERFVVAVDKNTVDDVAANLLSSGFIKDQEAFKIVFGTKEGTFAAGGYKLSKNMSAAQIVKALRDKPYMKWIIIPEGLRKEEIAELLANALGWTADQKEKWISTYTSMKYDQIEGVYFPDTYLIPVDEEPLKVAERLVSKFNEKFAAYLPRFNGQNIKWTTGLTFASIVQREAANDSDMPLIAGILWNRLEQNMALNVDATLQYVRGDTGKGWWASISTADKKTDSPYNTYLNKGLPPHPICNPGIPAIEATLNPAKTDCLYYLHDANRVTHCAKTYEEHLENIEKYLRTSD